MRSCCFWALATLATFVASSSSLSVKYYVEMAEGPKFVPTEEEVEVEQTPYFVNFDLSQLFGGGKGTSKLPYSLRGKDPSIVKEFVKVSSLSCKQNGLFFDTLLLIPFAITTR